MLARTDANGSAYYHADGSGNITTLINNQQVPVATYLYDPFGKLLSLSGPLAEANTYRLLSKDGHQQSGLVYFGYRYYEPNFQRWLNQDPIGEDGGINLHGFVGNDPVSWVDSDGLSRNKFPNPPRRFGNPRSIRGLFSPPWTKGKYGGDEIARYRNALDHWRKHQSEFPELKAPKEYMKQAHRNLNNPPKQCLVQTNKKGDIGVYDPQSNTLTISDPTGAPKTMFRPDPAIHKQPSNLDYFNQQFPLPYTAP